MSDAVESPAPSSAGQMLRAAREAQGLRLEVLAHALKVPPQKLESLEAGRFDELPDTAFTRGLAQAICRSLKIDPTPVLALLPQASGYRLEQIGEGLNTPYRERPGRLDPPAGGLLASPAVWGPALLLLAASVVYWLPPGLLSRLHEQATEVAHAAPAAPLPSVETLVAGPTITTEPSTEAAAVAEAGAAESAQSAAPSAPSATMDGDSPIRVADGAASAAAAAPESLLQVQASKTSWVEVIDARGHPLLSRLVKPGEKVALDGAVPLKIRIGNAADTQLVFRGEPLPLAPYTRDNLARLELK